MKISITDLGKKFQKEWIFRHMTFDFEKGQSYAITGPNGSGKSTLLQLVTGFFPPTEGKIQYFFEQQEVLPENYFKYFDIAAPYLELVEEFTLLEFLNFHFKFKKLSQGLTIDKFLKKTYLEQEVSKLIKNFSSGMKQRLKLGLAFYSESEICLLDEPTSNLDQKGIDWYLKNIELVLSEKLVIISSNQSYEHNFCKQTISIPDYK